MFSLTVVNEKLFGVTTAGGLYGGGRFLNMIPPPLNFPSGLIFHY
jgi:hypothetical protein